MKVTTSCSGRFWVFNQAYELHRQGILHRLINDYPRFMTRRWGIPNEKVTSLVANGVLSRIANRLIPQLPSHQGEILGSFVHSRFSHRLARVIPHDSDVLIGLSSFCLEAIDAAKAQGMLTVVDHGSPHQAFERQILREEDAALNLTGFTYEPPQWIIDKEQKEFILADHVMVLSEYAKRTLVKEGIEAEKIFVNPCGVDLDEFYPGVKEDKTFRVIQCGGLVPRKGVHYLVQAFHELNLPESELWLIGAGADSSPLKGLFSSYQSDRIIFKGAFPQRALCKQYQQGSVFVLNSISDGFGMVVSQAMASGLPVIVTENVGAADLIEDGVNGYVIPIRNPDTLKERLVYLYENPDILAELSQNALHTVRHGNTWQDYGERLVRFLEHSLSAEDSCSSSGKQASRRKHE